MLASIFPPGKGPPSRNGPANASPSMLRDLGRKVREFSFGLWKLRHLKSVPADMQDEYQSLLRKVGAIETMVTKSFGALSDMAKWAGLSGLPVIPIGTAAVMVAGIAYGSRLILDFMRRVDARRIQAGDPGIPYEQALKDASAVDSGGSILGFDFGGKWVLPIIAAGAAWFLFGRK